MPRCVVTLHTHTHTHTLSVTPPWWTMQFSKQLRGSAFAVCLTVLVFMVTLETGTQLDKYFRRQTTIAHTHEKHNALPLPAASFCPGFKKERTEGIHWLRWSFSEERVERLSPGFNDSGTGNNEPIDDAEDLWSKVTFTLEELFVYVVHREDLNLIRKYSTADLTEENSTKCLYTKEYDTFIGRCFTLVSRCAFPVNNTIEVKLNMSIVPRMPLYLHHHRAILGLNENFWPSPVTTEKIWQEEAVDLSISKKVKIRTHGSSVTEEDYFDCIDREVAELMSEVANGTQLACYFPSFGSLFGLATRTKEKLPACSVVQDYIESYHLFYPVLYEVFDSGCEVPSTERVYITSRKDQPLSGRSGGLTTVYLYFDTVDVDVEEEKKLMDISALVPAIGGSVGIFLGWSFLDLAKYLLKAKKNP